MQQPGSISLNFSSNNHTLLIIGRPPTILPNMMYGSSTQTQQIPLMHEEILAEKSLKWAQLNKRRYGEKRKFGYVEAQKELLPPEVLRYSLLSTQHLIIMY